MKKLLLVLFLVAVSGGVQAQNMVLDHLAKENELGHSVIVKSNIDIEFSQPKDVYKVRGYRIRIFFDNTQSSRWEAKNAEIKFKNLYPGLNAYQEYVSPYFRVTVGDFLTRLEAVSLWGKLKNEFPTAFVVSHDIPYSLVLDVPDIDAELPDSLGNNLPISVPVVPNQY